MLSEAPFLALVPVHRPAARPTWLLPDGEDFPWGGSSVILGASGFCCLGSQSPSPAESRSRSGCLKAEVRDSCVGDRLLSFCVGIPVLPPLGGRQRGVGALRASPGTVLGPHTDSLLAHSSVAREGWMPELRAPPALTWVLRARASLPPACPLPAAPSCLGSGPFCASAARGSVGGWGKGGGQREGGRVSVLPREALLWFEEWMRGLEAAPLWAGWRGGPWARCLELGDRTLSCDCTLSLSVQPARLCPLPSLVAWQRFAQVTRL